MARRTKKEKVNNYEAPKTWITLRRFAKTPIGSAFFEPLGLKQLLDDAIFDCSKAKTEHELRRLVQHYRKEINRAVPAALTVHLTVAWALHSAISATDGIVLYLALAWYAILEILRK